MNIKNIWTLITGILKKHGLEALEFYKEVNLPWIWKLAIAENDFNEFEDCIHIMSEVLRRVQGGIPKEDLDIDKLRQERRAKR